MSKPLSAFSPFWARAVLTAVLQLSLPILAMAQVTKTWTGGSGNWNDGMKWSGGTAPGINDIAIIAPNDGAARTVNFNATSFLTALYVDLAGPGAAASTLSMPNSANLNVHNFWVGGWNGVMATAGRGIVDHMTGTVNITPGSGPFDILDVGVFAGSTGTYNLSGTGILSANAHEYIGDVGTGFFNHTGGTNIISGAGHNLYIGGGPNNGTGTYTISNNGSLLSAGGDVVVGNTSTGTGTLTIQNQASVQIANNLTINSHGTVNLNGGTLRFNTANGLNRLNFTAGTIQLAGNRTLDTDDYTAFLFGSPNFPPSSLTIPSGKGLHVEGNATLLQPNQTVIVSGGSLTSANLTAGVFLNSGGTIAVTNGGTMTTTGNATLGQDAGSSGNITVRHPGSKWNIAGNLTVGNGGIGILNVWDQSLVHVGSELNIGASSSVDLRGGTLRFANNILSNINRLNFVSGTIQLAGDRTLGVDPTVNVLFGNLPNIETGKGLTIEGTATLETTLTLDGGTLTVGTLVNSGSFNFIAGTLAVTQAGANLNFPIVTGNPSTINVNANNVALGSSSSLIGFNHQGTLNVGANTLTLNSAGYAKLGVLTTLAGGTINAFNGLALGSGSNLQATGAVNGRVTGELGSVIDATGALALGDSTSPAGFNDAGELRTKQFSVTLNSSAAVGLGNLTTIGSGALSGTLNATNGFVVDFDEAVTGLGTINSTNTLAKRSTINGTVQGNSVAQPITLSGYIKGTGTFTNVNFTGTFSPGLSPTILTVGNIAMSNSSTLIMELGGTAAGSGYDQIQSAGALVFDGTLQIALINGFTPVAGQAFNLFDFISATGTFDTLQLPTFVGLTWNTSQLYTTGVLSLAAAGLPGDYNQNGTVDAADFTVWRNNLGSGTSLPNDDTAGVGPDDYTRWKNLFGESSGSGSGASTGSSSAPVPEPATLVMLLVGILALSCHRRATRAACRSIHRRRRTGRLHPLENQLRRIPRQRLGCHWLRQCRRDRACDTCLTFSGRNRPAPISRDHFLHACDPLTPLAGRSVTMPCRFIGCGRLFVLATSILAVASSARAADNVWTNGAGNLNWDTTSANWTIPSVWNNANGDVAVFSGAGFGAITVATPITAKAMRFNVNYSLAGSSIALSTGGPAGSSVGEIHVSQGSGATTIDNELTGTVGMIKTGPGRLILTAPSTYTGGTLLSAGSIEFQSTGTLLGDVNIFGNLRFANSGAETFPGVISGTGSVTKTSGNPALILTGENTYTGGTSVLNTATLQIGNGGTAGSIVGNVSLGGGGGSGELIFNRSDASSFGGVISGMGTVTKLGAGTLQLTGANTYIGSITVSAGTLRIGAGGTTGSVAGNINNNAEVAFFRSDATFYGNFIAGTGRVTKLGAGTLSLSNENSYTGATTISSGTLALSGIGSFALSPTIEVDAGAALDVTGLVGGANHDGTQFALSSGQTLQGLGTINGGVNLRSGSTLAPGGSPGEITVLGEIAQQAGATLAIEIGGTAPGVQYDVVSVTGNVVLAGDLLLDVLDGFVPNAADTFTILNATGSVSGSLANVPNGQRLSTSDGLGSFIVNYGSSSSSNPKQIVLSSFLATALPGDYNQNGTVDAADYTAWRDNLGSGTALPNDDTAGVAADDYTRWKTHFGESNGSGSGATAGRLGSAAADLSSSAEVPEPATSLLLLVVIGPALIRQDCRFRGSAT